MEFTVSITEQFKQAALERARATTGSGGQPLSAEAFVQKIMDRQLDTFVQAYLVTKLTKLDFLNRLTADERIAIRAAAAQSPAIHDYMAMLDAAQDVDLTDARTIGGVHALEAAGLIGEGRAAEILAL